MVDARLCFQCCKFGSGSISLATPAHNVGIQRAHVKGRHGYRSRQENQTTMARRPRSELHGDSEHVKAFRSSARA